MTKKSARDALRAERERQAAQERRRENFARVGIALVVVLAIVAIAGVVQWQRSRIDADAAAPAGVVEGYSKSSGAGTGAAGLGNGVGLGEADAPVVVEMFEDFSCPHCQEFEAGAEKMISQQVESGKVRVVYYPVTLDNFGRPTELSANAFACAADEGRAKEMHNALYINFRQDWTTDQLVALGRSVGLDSGSFRSCVREEKFAEWVQSIDQTATDRGVSGTPTVFVDGKPLDPEDTSPTALRLAITDALAGKP
ncbi:thioredoxin domain-containing protein [Actinopolymorpha sp. B11F2]|uniref:DsbA family protein n=1 Tax=Actinopolymorpha sp. B11F2 TaxID=3160862 RepID=UPI0032E41A87